MYLSTTSIYTYPKVILWGKIIMINLSIPGTSVPSEKIFSTAGVLVNKVRSRLSSSVIDQIIYSNCNNEHNGNSEYSTQLGLLYDSNVMFTICV